ncbi:MAG: DUF1007 family protein [Candidatus Muiribacteriaceae bacterium]
MKKIILVFSILFASLSVFSHPHVFVDIRPVIYNKGSDIESIELIWYYDELFSSAIIEDFDKNGDHKFQKDEVKELHDVIFTRMKEYSYYTYISIDGEALNTVPIFKPEIKGPSLVFSFRYNVGFQQKKDKKQKIEIACYDTEYYHAMQYTDHIDYKDKKHGIKAFFDKKIVKAAWTELEIKQLELEF